MPGRTAREAFENFAQFMAETLSCITEQPLAAYQESEHVYKILFAEAAPLRCSTGSRFYLQVTQVCTVERAADGQYKAHTREYSYVFSDSDTFDHHGIVAYHWHPNDFDLRVPHLHLKITPNLGYPEIERKISRAHFPTSRVCLEDFLTLLLNYYDIKSPLHHSTYRRILRKNKDAFSKGATWTINPRP